MKFVKMISIMMFTMGLLSTAYAVDPVVSCDGFPPYQESNVASYKSGDIV